MPQHRQAGSPDRLVRWFSLVVGLSGLNSLARAFFENSESRAVRALHGASHAGCSIWKKALSVDECWQFAWQSVKRQQIEGRCPARLPFLLHTFCADLREWAPLPLGQANMCREGLTTQPVARVNEPI